MQNELLTTLDDAQLDDVNGGLSFSLMANDTTLAGLSLTAGDGKLSGSVTVLGHTIGASLGLKISL